MNLKSDQINKVKVIIKNDEFYRMLCYNVKQNLNNQILSINKSVAKITQGGGVAAPVGGQILSEVLPYLELQEDNKSEEEEAIEIIVPELRNKTVEEVRKEVEDLGLELEINQEADEDINEKIVMNQVPLPGIKINSGSKIYISI